MSHRRRPSARRTLRTVTAALAPLALAAALAPTAQAADTGTRGLWTLSTRGDTVVLKFVYTAPPEDEDAPYRCVAVLDTGRSVTAGIGGTNYRTVELVESSGGHRVATARCEDNDGELRSVGSIDFRLPGPPTLHYVATRHFRFDDDD